MSALVGTDHAITGRRYAPPIAPDRVPPHAYFVGSAVFHYLGPSFAVLLFARVPVGGVAWLRMVSAGVVFALWRRPWRALLSGDRHTRALIAALGIVLATMNYCFYNAIDALPLGTVAALEFVGPLVLAIAGTRSHRNLAAVALAATGVYLLTDVRLASDPVGLVWAFANAVLFSFYIVLAHRLARLEPTTKPTDRLGASMIVAAVAITPLGLTSALPALSNPVLLGAGIGVGMSSSVIPYVFDQLAMSRLHRSTYALFVSLLPATAVLIGVIVLQQIPTWIETAATGLIIGGIVIHRDAQPPARPDSRAVDQ